MTPEKIAVLVVTVVIAVLLSLTLLSSPGTPVTEVADAPKIEAVPAPSDTTVQGGAAPLGLQEILDGGAATQLAAKPNNKGAAPAAPAISVVVPTTVRVAAGETLEIIARRLYGRPGAVSEILAANPGVNPKRLKIGQELKLPRAPTRTGSSAVLVNAGPGVTPTVGPVVQGAPNTTVAPAVTGRTHVVAKGERLGTIAKSRYGSESAWKRIYDANRDKLSNPNKLVAGMKLRIP